MQGYSNGARLQKLLLKYALGGQLKDDVILCNTAPQTSPTLCSILGRLQATALSLSPSLSTHKMLRGNGEDKKKLSKKKAGSGHLLDTAVGCSDMVLLDPLTVDNMVKNLQERYKAGDIYVS